MASKKRTPALECHPLTPERWADFETLFGVRGACGGCWCMTWRLSRKEFVQGKGAANRAAIHAIVQSGERPGILAYQNGEPVGWCAVAPREAYPALERSRVLKKVDDTPVWSVSCLFVRKDCRKQGVSVALLKAVIGFVRERGGTVVEGYPVLPYSEDMPAPFAWTGTASAFLKAGFHECVRHSPKRPIMRFEIPSPLSSRERGADCKR